MEGRRREGGREEESKNREGSEEGVEEERREEGRGERGATAHRRAERKGGEKNQPRLIFRIEGSSETARVKQGQECRWRTAEQKEGRWGEEGKRACE